MSNEDKQLLREKLEKEAYHTEDLTAQMESEMKQYWDKRGDFLKVTGDGNQDLSPADVLANSRYQKVKEAD